MTISVAIAAYCGEKFIGEQLASIAGQTVVPDEVVICDDSPDDATGKAVMPFTGKLNIRYFRNESPLGAAANFNRAVSLCRGDIIFLCDQDDVWYPQKVAEMSKVLASGGIKAVFCDSDVTGADGSPLGFTHLESRGYGELKKSPPGFWQEQFSLSCRRFPAAGHDMAFTGEFWAMVSPIPELKNCHDNYLGVAGAALDAWYCVPQSLGIFRRHEKSTSQAGKKPSFFEQFREAKASVKNNSFQWNAKLFTAVSERLEGVPEARKQLLKERIAHSQKRSDMPQSFWKRLSQVVAEWRNGNYHKFGRGWKNIIQDLFLR